MSPVFLSAPAEVARLDAHFVRVLGELSAQTPPRLGPSQRRARARHIERLDAYRRRAEFPKNRRFPGRLLPHFIDEGGVRCAMAHLMEGTSARARELVHHVARTANYARIRDLAAVPELVAWLDENGLTLGEAARIQPSYCGTPADLCVCPTAIVSGMLKGTPAALGDGGAGLAVSAVFGPVTDVKVNDVVPLVDPAGLGPSDTVYARWNSGAGEALVWFVAAPDGATVAIPVSVCSFSRIVSIPGSLPTPTLDQALSSATLDACEQVLAQYDAKWGEVQGGSECFGLGGSNSGGTSSGGTSSGGSSGGTSSGGTGGAGTTGDDSADGCGCVAVGHGAGGAEATIAISAALILHGARRRRRRA